MAMDRRRKPIIRINKFMDSENTQDHNVEKKCWKCGTSLSSDAKFCPTCQADISFEIDTGKKGFKLGGRIERLAAFMIDELIATICLLPLGTTFFSALGNNDQEMMVNIISDKVTLVMFLTFVPIIIQAYLITTQGQSIGKMIMSLRIVNAKDGTNPGFLKAFFVRRVVIFNILPIPLLSLPLLFFISYFVVNVLFIFRSDRRCVHDWIGRTIVVESKIHKLVKKDK